jgi:TRAP-type C4-dicarboxylate transport system permease small subunit
VPWDSSYRDNGHGGTGALAFRFGGQVQLFGSSQSVAAVFIAIALFVWGSFYMMDRFWYHELLRASVKYAETLGNPAVACGLNVKLDLSAQIREANQSSLRMSGGAKINLFYAIVGIGLFSAFLLLVFGYVTAQKSLP